MISRLLPPLRSAWRALPMPVRRTVGQTLLRGAQPWLAAGLPRAAAGVKGLQSAPTVLGVFHAALGHGTAARLLMSELEQAGLAPAALDVTAQVGADYNDARAAPGAVPAVQGPLILAVNPDTALVALAGRAALLRDRPVIGYFVWELETPPRSWRNIRHAVHALWSPSRFSADGLAKAFDMPVAVAPHPVALARPPSPTEAARARGRARIGAAEGDFVAVSSFSATSSLARKNPFGAITAFEAAFGADPRRRLVLRCLGGHRFPGALAALRRAVRDAKTHVLLIDQAQGLDELHDLYAACDVLLALHRSEGFGLNIAEAMLSQRAVVATGWSGNLDFMDHDSAALVDFTLAPVRDPQGIYRIAGARWAEPNLDSAVAHLRRLADDPEFRQGLAARGAAMAQAKLSGGAAAQALRPWLAP